MPVFTFDRSGMRPSRTLLLALGLVAGLCDCRVAGQSVPALICQPRVLGPEPYLQTVARTATHCAEVPERCTAPPPESVVEYRWPSGDGGREARLDLLRSVQRLFVLPFQDERVRLLSGWLYAADRWHMAADFGIDGRESFVVRAAAAGQVIFVGWDGFSGNTVILSHDAAGERDAYRTLYMHLRGGAAHDCASSWRESVRRAPPASPLVAAYKAQLERSGCSELPETRSPDPRFWGTDRDILDPRLLGREVAAGSVLGRAGDTGPGGFATADDPNVHLHVFFVRRDPGDGAWILFDPWGVYNEAGCYPLRIDEAVAGRAFPSAWR